MTISAPRTSSTSTSTRTATFRSRNVSWHGSAAKVDGELTIVGVTQPVVLDVELLGMTIDPWGGGHAVFSAFTED